MKAISLELHWLQRSMFGLLVERYKILYKLLVWCVYNFEEIHWYRILILRDDLLVLAYCSWFYDNHKCKCRNVLDLAHWIMFWCIFHVKSWRENIPLKGSQVSENCFCLPCQKGSTLKGRICSLWSRYFPQSRPLSEKA